MSEEIKPEPEPADMGAIAKRLSEYLDRLETGGMDEKERRAHEAEKRAQEIAKERDTLAARAAEWESRYKRGLVESLLARAANEAGAYRADQVAALLRPHVRIGEKDEPILALAGKDGNATEFIGARLVEGVRAFLAENPNLAAGGAGGGAGSRPSSRPVVSQKPTLKELKAMRDQLEAQARQSK